MNKAMKRRQRRCERDLRWIQRKGVRTVFAGSHRHKKIVGLPKQEGDKRGAFWCEETDATPLFARLSVLGGTIHVIGEVGDGS